MDNVEAKRVRIGQRVLWDGKPDDAGTVVDRNLAGVKINWDNGQSGWMHYDAMLRIRCDKDSPKA